AYAFTPAGSSGDLPVSAGSSAPVWTNPNTLFWRVNGNSGRTPSSSNIGTAVNNNFIGTTDANDFVFARNNLEAFRIREVGGNQIVSFNSGAGGYTTGSVGSLNTVMTIGGAQNSSGVSNPVVLIMDRDINNDAPNNIFGGIAFGEPGSANRAGQTRIEGRRSAVANSSGASDLPTDLVFYTTPDGTNTARDWMRLSHDGALVLGENDNQVGYGPGRLRGTVAVGTDAPGQNLTIDAGNGTGTGGSGNIIFRTASPAGSSGPALNTMTERVRITNQGRVGIGTTNPNTLVDVVGGASGSETRMLTLRSNFVANNTGTAIALINSTSATSNVGAELAAITTDATNGASQLVFRTHGGGGSFGALLERMRLTNQGFLGIGTTNPLDMLHVDNSASGASSARIGRTSTQFDNRLFFGDGSFVYVGEQNADNRLYLRGNTMTIDIGGSTGGANGRVLTSNGTTVSWQPPVPIGAIIAWVNHIPGTPPLPPGWVECNGGTVSDPESPLNGQPIPDLNNTPSGTFGTPSGGYYLRGTTGTTGVTQSDRAPDFQIEQSATNQGTQAGTVSNDGSTSNYSPWLRNYYLDDSLRWRYINGEVRPVTYTVRWIMRIK
ncbi:MAG: hypothetical protein NZM65_09810, partial [Flavobacteriales bacterium]|nr:hypothetical protein [Flavobacteriales bacterium]MDW8410966.1 hypothetical protein [Flavobacteriales bacterium]